MPDLLSFFLKKGFGQSFLSFSNNDNKNWILPIKNAKTALNIYQPSSVKGKLLKLLLPYLKNNKLFQKKLRIAEVNYCLDENLEQLLKSIFKTDVIEFAIFGGTPSKNQKTTIQLFTGSKILGYCKVSNDKAVKELFIHEKEVLKQLNEVNVKGIPICLYNGQLNNHIDVFIQSTIKTNSSKLVHSWGKEHWKFLSLLKKKTEQTLLFEETDFFNTLQLLLKNSSYLTANDVEIIKNATLKVTNHYNNKSVCFSAYHSDFTPWNMFEEKRELFVFDFEYAKMTYPPFLDWFHFFTQTSIFEKGWDADQILNHFNAEKDKIKKDINDPEFYYLCYLLDVLSLYVTREQGDYTNDVKRNLDTWINLIDRL